MAGLKCFLSFDGKAEKPARILLCGEEGVKFFMARGDVIHYELDEIDEIYLEDEGKSIGLDIIDRKEKSRYLSLKIAHPQAGKIEHQALISGIKVLLDQYTEV